MKRLARLLRLLVGVVDVGANHEGELVRFRFPAGFVGVPAVVGEQVAGLVHPGEEGGVGVVIIGGPLDRLRAAGAWHPAGRVGLLDGQHPRVDGAVVVVLALPAEGAGSGPGLLYQVVAFLEPLAIVDRVGVVGPGLDADSPHEAGDDAPAGNDVQHGDFLGQPHRVVGSGQHIAQHQYLGAVGDAGQDAAGDVDLDVHARRRVVMLVNHQAVEAHFLGVLVLVEVALEQVVGRAGVEIGVGEGEAHGGILVGLRLGEGGVGELGEVEDFKGHGVYSVPQFSFW